MIHVGDITKLSGYTLPVVDIITGGSPCQDLSVAGKRAGLDGERSGLFMEQIRIVKEMRERDRRTGRTGWLIRPRFMVWENVPGAFSSNKGKDFQAVLSEIVKIAEPDAPDVPMPDKGKWSKAGCLYSDLGDWSIAWRVHDAQFWGVPQRRKRIALVADFGGLAAPEILFEREGLSWHSEPGGAERQGVAGSSGGGSEKTISFQERAGKPGGGKGILIQNERVGALSTLNNQSVCYGIGCYNSGAWLSDNPESGIYQAETARTLDLNGGSPACNQGGMAVVSFKAGQGSKAGGNQMNAVLNVGINGDIAGTLDANYYKGCGERQGVEREVVCVGNGQLNQMSMSEQANTLDTMHDQQAVLTFDKEMYNCGQKMTGEPQARYDTVAPTVRADTHPSGVCQSVVRRLTPLECERLQGYPDGWTDIGEWVDSKGKKHKEADSPRYKALGNSIALPFWAWMARRICAQYERPMTMGSLFDGIGGFPLVFERAGAKAVWASEIEEFCVAVTKRHFPEGEGS